MIKLESISILTGEKKEKIYQEHIGKHSLHNKSNDKGNRIIHFAASKNMKMLNTTFEHKRMHKVSWVYPDGETENQIDHVLIDFYPNRC